MSSFLSALIRKTFSLPPFLWLLFFSLPVLVSGAENIPPLVGWNDPSATSLKERIAAKSPAEAADLVAEELLKAAQELLAVLETVADDGSNVPEVLEKLSVSQLKVRALSETVAYFANRIPQNEQKAWKTAALAKISSPLQLTAEAFTSKNMTRGAEEINLFLERFSESEPDIWDEVQKREAPPAEPPAAAPNAAQDINSLCRRFLDSYQSKPAEAETTLLSIIGLAQKPFLKQPSPGSTAASPIGSPANNDAVFSETESSNDSVQSIATVILKRIFRDPDSKLAAKAAAAYCLLAVEDIVPEMTLFLSKSKKNPGIGICFESLPMQNDYAQDPRIQCLMIDYLILEAKDSNAHGKVVAAFSYLKGGSQFVLPYLDNPLTSDLAFAVLAVMGDGDAALMLLEMLEDDPEPEIRSKILDSLGKIGDARIALPLLRMLIVPDLKDKAKECLLQIGAPAEETVLSAFNAKDEEIDLLTLEIIRQIGTWKSIARLAGQLIVYAKAKTLEESLDETETKPRRVIETEQREELIQKTMETGTIIIARLSGTQPPSLGLPGNPKTSPSSAGSKTRDEASEELESQEDPLAANASLKWILAISETAILQYEEMTSILSGVVSSESGKKKGKEYQNYMWVKNCFDAAMLQAETECLPNLETSKKRAGASYLENITSKYKRVENELKRIQKDKKTYDGFQEGSGEK